MLNVVTGPVGYPAAVLIRSVEGISGPGRLTKALAITGKLNRQVASKKTGIWFSEAPILSNWRVTRSPRIGADYASPARSGKALSLHPRAREVAQFPGYLPSHHAKTAPPKIASVWPKDTNIR
jgi:hypothetical protein